MTKVSIKTQYQQAIDALWTAIRSRAAQSHYTIMYLALKAVIMGRKCPECFQKDCEYLALIATSRSWKRLDIVTSVLNIEGPEEHLMKLVEEVEERISLGSVGFGEAILV
ncbi:hypothetical protein RCL1_004882 [Eukaryota sp. TZLM3-RCL]